eukprot:9466057-Pyramimonas_sp.AAC.1
MSHGCPADADAAGAPAETDAAAGSADDPALPDGSFSFSRMSELAPTHHRSSRRLGCGLGTFLSASGCEARCAVEPPGEGGQPVPR